MNRTTLQIVFITGPSLTANSWQRWSDYFTKLGYECLSPGWPGRNVPAQQLRNLHPDYAIPASRLSTVIAFFAELIRSMKSRPIVIGHSIGGLIAQLLIQQDLAIAGILVHSFPPPSLTNWQPAFLIRWFNPLALAALPNQTYLLSFRRWTSHFTNALLFEEQKATYYEYCIPESNNIIRDAFRCEFRVDFEKSHPPLLFIAGGRDRLISVGSVYSNFERYVNEDSLTTFRNAPDECHLSLLSSRWKIEADIAGRWLSTLF